jgi:signal transduction histidine kinase
VLTESDRLSGLVEDLLDFSRMERGKMEFTALPVDISRILAESADMYAELSKQHGIELLFNPAAEEVLVLGDQNRLKQVFING